MLHDHENGKIPQCHKITKNSISYIVITKEIIKEGFLVELASLINRLSIGLPDQINSVQSVKIPNYSIKRGEYVILFRFLEIKENLHGTCAGADLENTGGGVWPIPKRQNVDSLCNYSRENKLILS